MNNDQDINIERGCDQFTKKTDCHTFFQREEDRTSEILEIFFREKNIPVNKLFIMFRQAINFLILNKPTLLLNSHHDTVKPNSQYTL